MAGMSRMTISRVSIGLVAALAAVIAFAAPAAAHSTIAASTPAEGQVLTALPAEFSVTANEDLADVTGTGEGFALQIIDASGKHYETGELTISGPTLSTPAAAGDAGDYVLAYQIVSADGHPVSGEIHFGWAPEGEVVAPVETTEPQPEPEPEVTTNDDIAVMPISAQTGPPSWLGGAVAIALLVIGGLAAAFSPKR